MKIGHSCRAYSNVECAPWAGVVIGQRFSVRSQSLYARFMSRRRLGGAVAVVVAMFCMLAAPRQAAASCIPQDIISVPADGATVPPTLTRYWSTSPYLGDVRITGPTGPVALRAPILNRGLYEIELAEALLPNADYVVEQIDGSNTIRRSTFHTSAAVDSGAPQAPLITDLQAGAAKRTFVGGENLRDGLFLLSAQTSTSADAPVFEVSVQKQGDTPQPMLMQATSTVEASSSLCGNLIAYIPGDSSACLTVTAIDYAGRRSPPTTACTPVRNCGTVNYEDSYALNLFTCTEPSGCNVGRSSNGTNSIVAFTLFTCATIAARRRRR